MILNLLETMTLYYIAPHVVVVLQPNIIIAAVS